MARTDLCGPRANSTRADPSKALADPRCRGDDRVLVERRATKLSYCAQQKQVFNVFISMVVGFLAGPIASATDVQLHQTCDMWSSPTIITFQQKVVTRVAVCMAVNVLCVHKNVFTRVTGGFLCHDPCLVGQMRVKEQIGYY